MMNSQFERLMQEAARLTQLTKSGDLQAATAAIQASLAAHLPGGQFDKGFAGHAASAKPYTGKVWSNFPEAAVDKKHEVIDVEARDVSAPSCPSRQAAGAFASPVSAPSAATPLVNTFITGSYGEASNRRDFKLYIPPGAGQRPLPLVVMLHGCTQNPDDFAAGTAMNEAARAQGFFVLYPEQSQKANPQRCWNWFKHSHQMRGRGEPALLAGMTRDTIARYAIDADRIYIAGLSAGGAMAAIMGQAYPELFAAVGVHSGLAAYAANDLPSALAAMSGNKGPLGNAGSLTGKTPASSNGPSDMPTIVFHGDADNTVHPSNGDQVITAAAGKASAVQAETVTAAGGRSSVRRVYRNDEGSVMGEHWLVKGAPHAWSGGSPQGSYTDPSGPDASLEMMRFFMAHPRRAK